MQYIRFLVSYQNSDIKNLLKSKSCLHNKRANSAEKKCVCSTEERNIPTDSGHGSIPAQAAKQNKMIFFKATEQ